MEVTIKAEINDWDFAEDLLKAVVEREVRKFNRMNEVYPHKSTQFTFVCEAGRVEVSITKLEDK